MDHVELKEVSLPTGTPLLMANQTFPWNGDGYLAGEVLRLRDKHGLKFAIETGTCLGVTTSWLAEHFEEVSTCELHKPFLDLARAFLSDKPGSVKFRGGSSPGFIVDAIVWHGGGDKALLFLDAHGISGTGKEACPLLDELTAIAEAGVMPCVVIHDFAVPGTDFGFDKMPDGRPFNLELIQPYLDRIYGEGKWKSNYPTKVEGANRGWISIEAIL